MSVKFPLIEKAELSWQAGQPYSRRFQDRYFSQDSGIDESRYVFLEANDLPQRWQRLEDGQLFTIAETGFGTGLNFLCSWAAWAQSANPRARLHFISCEKFPLSREDLILCLAQFPSLKQYADAFIATYPVLTPGFHHLDFDDGRVRLSLMLGDVLDCYQELLLCGDPVLEPKLRGQFVDAWFLDGFAPAKNAAMWSDAFFHCVSLLSCSGTTATTFSAAAVVKHALSTHGFEVEKMKGFGRKRHMLKAKFGRTVQKPSSKAPRKTPWHLPAKTSIKEKTATIIGAGLAGCFMAYRLAEAGWQVNILDKLSEPGQAASANTQAVLFPKFSAYQSPMAELMLSGFLYAANFFKRKRLNKNLQGSLLLAYNEKEQRLQSELAAYLEHYPELGRLLDKVEASALAGIPLNVSGVFIDKSGYLNMPELCVCLIDHPNIHFQGNTAVESLEKQDNHWRAAGYLSEILILANAQQCTHFEQTAQLFPVRPLRGQMTAIQADQNTRDLRIPICAKGHILPAIGEKQWLGASYWPGSDNADYCHEDDELNITQVQQSIQSLQNVKKLDAWAAVRANTTDYLPLVGAVPKKEEFSQRYARLQANSKLWIPEACPVQQGLYIFSAFGSKGLTTIPLLSESLLNQIENQQNVLPSHLLRSVSPSRFLFREIIRQLK